MSKFVPAYRVRAADRDGQVGEVKCQRVQTEEELQKLRRRLERSGYTKIKIGRA
jgi:hypothetical protein